MRNGNLREWIDPTRIYNTTVPAERLAFLWGLAIYPLVVIFVLLSAAIIVLESVFPATNIPDYIGIITYGFILAWVFAAVSSCLRRLRYLGMSPAWVWLIILPLVNLIFCLYLLLKSGPSANPEAA